MPNRANGLFLNPVFIPKDLPAPDRLLWSFAYGQFFCSFLREQFLSVYITYFYVGTWLCFKIYLISSTDMPSLVLFIVADTVNFFNNWSPFSSLNYTQYPLSLWHCSFQNQNWYFSNTYYFISCYHLRQFKHSISSKFDELKPSALSLFLTCPFIPVFAWRLS